MADSNIFNLDGMKSGLIPPSFNGSHPPYFLGGRYSYGKKYEDDPLTSKILGTSENENSFKTTALDLESSEAGTKQGGIGGPNRITPTINGYYRNLNSLDGKELNTVTLHQYVPQYTYKDTLISKELNEAANRIE